MKYIVVAEQHANGVWHFHALAWCNTKFGGTSGTKRQDFFDLDCPHCDKHHPNIQPRPAKKKTNTNQTAWETSKYEYILKADLDPLLSKAFLNPFMKNSKNYTKNVQDHENWLKDLTSRKLKEVEDFKMPFNPNNRWATEVTIKKSPDRRALIIIHGEPGCGKTKWAQTEFMGKRIFCRNRNNYPYEGYKGENVILWDDLQYDSKYDYATEIINCLNYYTAGQQHVEGATRYYKVYWPLKQQRYIIWLMNTDLKNSEHHWKPVLDDPRIKDRIKVVYRCVREVVELADMSDEEDELVIVD